MTRTPILISASFAVLLAVVRPVAAQGSAARARQDVWAQSVSDVTPDPAVRFGRLANGMRYAILKNATPKGQASLRLRIGTGSIGEADNEQGLAHFLEHLAFKGSTHVPAGEFVKILERKGLKFGPDTNASTSWTQTVYMLDLPETDPSTIDTGLMLVREQAGELTITPGAVQPERGVVLSEERLRDTPQYRTTKAQLGFWLKGQRVSERFPIGKTEVIQDAPADRIAAFYRAHYRPDNATVIVVGDVNVDEMEAKIRARFGDWRPTGAPGTPPDYGSPLPRKTQALVVVQPGAATTVQVAWVTPFDLAPDTHAKRRRDITEQLGFAILNRRLGRVARSPAPPFIAAGAGRQELFRSAKLTVLQVRAQPDVWRPALDAADLARRQAVRFGFTQAELDREIVELRTGLQAAVAGSATRGTPAIAAELVGSVEDDNVFTNPTQDLAEFETIVKGLTAQQVTASFRAAFTGQGPLVTLTTPAKLEGGDVALAAAFAAAEAKPVVQLAEDKVKPWPYTSFGKPGAVVERREVADLGTTFVRFANGVRLTVRPSKLRQQQVLAEVRVGNGLLDLPRDRASPTWATQSVTEGGLGKMTSEEIEQALADRVASSAFSVDDNAFQLSGTTRPADLGVQMQLLTAYITDPGLRPEAVERTRAAYRTALAQLEATPQGVLAKNLSELQHAGDLRWRFPTRAALDAAKIEDIRALFAGALASGPVEVVITGDVTVDAAVAAVASTVGALPARAARPVSPDALRVRFPAASATPIRLTHTGRADQAIAYNAWPGPDLLSDLKRARRVRVTQEVLQLRLTDQVRIAQGASYSPRAAYDASTVFPGYGYVAATVETPPGKMAAFDQTVAKITADLAATGPTADELDRAKKPRIEGVTKAQQTNEYWRDALEGGQTDPRKLDAARTAISDLQAVTAEDVRRTAGELFRADQAFRLRVEAAPTPGGAQPTAR